MRLDEDDDEEEEAVFGSNSTSQSSIGYYPHRTVLWLLFSLLTDCFILPYSVMFVHVVAPQAINQKPAD